MENGKWKMENGKACRFGAIQANPGKSNQIQPVLARGGLMACGAQVAGSGDGLEWRGPNPG